MTNVKAYTDSQLLEQVELIGGEIPNIGKYLIIGVQSIEDAFNIFDDKFYVFDGPKFKQVSTGTTNAGKDALFLFKNHNLPGAAVWKTNQWCPNTYTRGMHISGKSGKKMRALKQRKPVFFFRDSDENQNVNEQGTLYKDSIGLNIHGVDYNPFSTVTKEFIHGWSFGCQVWNRMGDYGQMINAVWKRNKPVDYALLKEF
ncbi:hypothetical protein [Maribacter sp. 2307UL18-2]|uniref:hypothetical protein n=1 Tax=Maribacter sp. 2307UL18-2 TaxID=3386274 RepID=UPI0039BC2F4E